MRHISWKHCKQAAFASRHTGQVSAEAKSLPGRMAQNQAVGDQGAPPSSRCAGRSTKIRLERVVLCLSAKDPLQDLNLESLFGNKLP